MPQKSGIFDTIEGDVREYPAREFAEYFGRFLTNGVFNGGQYLQVTATGTNSYVSISLGSAWIKGYAYSVYDEAVSLPITPATTLDRIDRIVLRLDTSTPVRSIKAIVLQGVPNANPVPPSLVRSGDIFDLSLAQVRVVANSIIVTQAKITDERMNSTVCGLVNSLIQVDTTVFQQKWDAFMASVQDQGFVTTIAFNAHKSDDTSHVYYGDDTGTANVKLVALSASVTTLKKGLGVAFTNKALNTGAVTINVNGLGAKPIVNSKGIALVNGNLVANGVYTLRYNGTAFILQGEGGGGTATTGDVRLGKTATVDSGDITGTMPNIALNGKTTNITAQNGLVTIPEGFSDGTGKVQATYIAKGKIASGNTTAGSNTIVTVTGLDFIPRIIRIRSASSSFPKPITVMHRGVQDFSGISHDIFATLDPSGTKGYGGDSTVDGRYTITSGGFTASIQTGNIPVYWEAEE
ncbi:hypothetical protein PMSD_18340 [Paenibacillus macquariensis subsp. defensor]|nr:hypothetical protein PMSD_18340 [Paenibacillus macquariensis subsp. defensor]